MWGEVCLGRVAGCLVSVNDGFSMLFVLSGFFGLRALLASQIRQGRTLSALKRLISVADAFKSCRAFSPEFRACFMGYSPVHLELGRESSRSWPGLDKLVPHLYKKAPERDPNSENLSMQVIEGPAD